MQLVTKNVRCSITLQFDVDKLNGVKLPVRDFSYIPSLQIYIQNIKTQFF